LTSTRGVPELTVVFVMFTGVFGAMLSGILLK
jgi:putative effector of murein hydrolase